MEVVSHRTLESAVRETVEMFIAKKAEEVAEKYKAQAMADLDDAIREAVTQTAVHFSKMIKIGSAKDELVITISDKRI